MGVDDETSKKLHRRETFTVKAHVTNTKDTVSFSTQNDQTGSGAAVPLGFTFG
jgi:hypothetical protein